MKSYASEYCSYITCILTVPCSDVPLKNRIRLSTVSMPSIFHAQAWREYQGLAREYMNLTFLTEETRQLPLPNITSKSDYLDYNYKGEV